MSQQFSNKRCLCVSILATMLGVGGVGTSGMAQAEGLYAGVGFGKTKVQWQSSFCTDASNVFDPGVSCSSDERDKGWKVFVGRQFDFLPYLAAELGYADLGKFTGSARGTAGGTPSTASADTKVNEFELTMVGTWPVSDAFGVIGRVGAYRWDVKNSESATGNVVAENSDETGSNITYGVGVKYDFTKTLGARAEWQRFKRLGDPDRTSRGDVDLFSVNLVLNFLK